MTLSQLAIIVNSILIAISFVLVGIMLNAGMRYSKNIGDSDIQNPMKWRMLWIILALTALALIAAVFNILLTFFPNLLG